MNEGQKVFIVTSLYICGKLEKNVENIYKTTFCLILNPRRLLGCRFRERVCKGTRLGPLSMVEKFVFCLILVLMWTI